MSSLFEILRPSLNIALNTFSVQGSAHILPSLQKVKELPLIPLRKLSPSALSSIRCNFTVPMVRSPLFLNLLILLVIIFLLVDDKTCVRTSNRRLFFVRLTRNTSTTLASIFTFFLSSFLFAD